MTDDIIEALTTIGNCDKVKEICEPNISQPKHLEEWIVSIPQNYHWLSDDEWNKLKFRTRGHFGTILKELRKYGQDVYVDGAIEALMYVTEQTWDIVRGRDKPMKIPPHYRYYQESYGADD